MTDLKKNIGDESVTRDSAGEAKEVERKPYIVTAERGLFKNGEQHPKGSVVMLDERTAKNFQEAGDVRPKEETGDEAASN